MTGTNIVFSEDIGEMIHVVIGSGEHVGGQGGGLHGPQGGGQEYVTREVAQGGQGYE